MWRLLSFRLFSMVRPQCALWLLIGGIIFDDYINRCILYETKKEIVAFRLERFYTINYKSILGFKGLKMWRKMYHEGKQNIGI